MESLEERLSAIEARFVELERELSDPEVYADQQRVQRISQERARLSEVVETARRWRAARAAADGAAEALRGEEDPEMLALFEEEERSQRQAAEDADTQLRSLLLPRDPNDDRNVIVEIRAGAGGDEAALFAAELLRMYTRYALEHRFATDLMSLNETGIGGIKEAI